ncbi:MAG: carbohydrate porin [Terrimicrobiaceae bacterium]|nr:carbohydrate porin [Terrimicrobiaceae bacterium]
MTIRTMNRRKPLSIGIHAGILALAALVPLHGGAPAVNPPSTGAIVSEWWNGKYASGNWLAARDALEDHGITPYGSWKGTFYGITGGGIASPRGAFDEEITLGLKLDLEKMAGLPGLSAQGSVRWRDGANPNAYVGASPAFNPSAYQLGKQWRLMPFFLTWESRDWLPVKDMFTISGGWQNPYHFFAQQAESKLFVNNAITQTKGIGANIPFNGTYAAWGGYAKIKPTNWSYAQAGLYMAIPDAVATSNHGLDLQGAYPAHRNGLYFISEAGVAPKIGGLPGKYAMGGYYWGLENQSFFKSTYDAKYGFYWQADQMLFREPAKAESAPLAKGPSEGKSFKEPVDIAPTKPGEQGLYFFSFINYAPKYDNTLPFYFHSGLVYKGLIPGRDLDQLGVAFALGNYSYDKILAEEDAGRTIHQTNEAVVEIDYRVQLSKFLYVQPFWQYLIRPNGTGVVNNANILGLHMGVTF